MADAGKETLVPDVALINLQACGDLNVLLGDVTGQEAVAGTSLIAPAMLLGTPSIARETQAMTPPEGMAVVHEFQLFRRASQSGAEPSADVLIREQVKPVSVVYDFEIQSGAALSGSMQTRLRFVTPEEMSGFRGTTFPTKYETPDTVWYKTVPIEAGHVLRYVELSHDENPIHTDDAAARAVGLSAAVLPGMLLCGLAETLQKAHFPNVWISEMKCRFMAAVSVGETVNFALVPRKRDSAGDVSAARIFAITEENVIAAIMDVLCEPVLS